MSEETDGVKTRLEEYLGELSGFLRSFDSRDYLLGVVSVMLVASLAGNFAQHRQSSVDKIDPVKAGNLTVTAVNENILYPSPNNVTASLVNVTEPAMYDLENFYRVRLNVSNPSGSQITSVYTKKDGSLAFLQFPRRLGNDFKEGKYH